MMHPPDPGPGTPARRVPAPEPPPIAAQAPNLLLLTAGLATLIFLSARLGLQMSIGSFGITPFWPRSGITFAAMLLYRRAAVPGIALGTLVEYGLGVGDLQGLRSPAVAGDVIALAALALSEALLGRIAVGDLATDLRAHPVRTTLRFVASCAFAALPSALAGPWLLHAERAAMSTLSEPVFLTLTWWVGDTTGMLVATPLLLLALAPALRVDRIAVQAFPALSLGLGFTLFTSYASGLQAREARLQQFDAESRRLAVALANHAELAARDLETMQHVFRRVALDRDEFRAIAAPMLARSPWQTTFAWLPRVDGADRARFEADANGLDGVAMRELAEDGSLVRAGRRAEYFPLAYTSPEFGREQLVGVDNAADHWRGPAVAHARDTGRLAITPPLHLVANSTDERLVQVMYAPIAPSQDLVAAPRAGREVSGLVSATIDLERLLRAALAQRDLTGQQVLLFDGASADTALSWTDSQHVSVLDGAALRDALEQVDRAAHRRLDVPVADRGWVLVCRPDWAGGMPIFGWVPGFVFGGGVAFTALITGFLMARRRRDEALQLARERLEDQVAERTVDLAASNARLRDEIEDHRRTEQLLEEASRRAESANRAKSLFLANMSHEIRTPLNAVLGYTQLLMEDQRQPPEARERLQVIQQAGNRLLGLINDVLDIAKIEAGGLQLHEEALDLRHELAEVAALFAPRASQKGLALRVDIDLDATPVVLGDRAKIGQIVLNLLGNALKFTEHGGITLSAWRAGDEVVVEVADTGPGMSDEEQAGLFLPFRQGAAGLDKGGTGLGLALSRNLAQAMGGRLAVESVAGAGTRVRLTLPLVVADAPSSPTSAFRGRQRLDPATPCRALVVEDDPHSRDVLVALLSQAGCTVGVACDGQEGLEACRRGAGGDAAGKERAPWDIVFSDIRMPRLDGLQMMRMLRADPRTASLPLVAVSASSLEHQRRDYIEQGFDDFVSKPYAFDEIYAMLVRHAKVRLVPAGAEVESEGPGAQDAPAAQAGPDAAAGETVAMTEAATPATFAAAATSGSNVEAPLPLLPSPPSSPRDAAWRDRLDAIRAAVGDGAMSAARRGLQALEPGDLSPAQRQQVDADLRAYDFDALGKRLARWIAEAEAST